MLQKMKKWFKFILLGGLITLCCGCKSDTMEDIEIITTNYPNEYIIEKLYGDHATISSIYPDGVDPDTYELTDKQLQDFAKKDLFIYTGLIDRERDLAIKLLDYNSDLKIIDSSYVLENDYDTDQLWNDPSFMLMMCQNVRISLQEYLENTLLKDEVEKNYEDLKVEISELDADIRLTVENAPYKTIVAADNAFRFLEKYGVTVYLLNDDTSEKDLVTIQDLIESGAITKIFTYEDNEITSNVQNIINQYPNQVSYQYFEKITILSDSERESKLDYLILMNRNLDALREELYHGTETT
ncbi:MAG TPA: zinc ABC transporter substrate-binding protein [Candidatus Onthousia faecigallinarum]|nr:zinc ABC transporter substrate-binding protein [Candidatus Onthousia faecigallinarum]